jgi:hypothetical protein
MVIAVLRSAQRSLRSFVAALSLLVLLVTQVVSVAARERGSG